ncbi:XRE family transcriptional regulator [Vannielia sp. SX4]|uniref:XRE family transcriptional regulator n=1 Tax=Vannielia sp. SX4 TaxID=3463852 RepID=UPI004058E73E
MDKTLKRTPYEHSRLAQLLDRQILKLKPKKSQRDIALEAGFRNVNMLSMIKSGASKLALDRVPALAAALEIDPRLLLRLALEQEGLETSSAAIDDVLGTVVSLNEQEWVREIREASNHSDPRLTSRSRAALRAIFGV